MIKRLLLLGACASLWFMFGASAPASADSGPHVAGAGVVADGCASCHRTHTAKAANLLKQAQPGLCYSCHGTTGTGATTDVQAGTGYAAKDRVAPSGALRGGGFVTARINSLLPSGQKATYSNNTGIVPVLAVGAATTSSHSVDGTVQTAWGNGPNSMTANAGVGVSLNCGSCHDPHGNGNYRVLKPLPEESGLAAVSTAIVEPVATIKTYTTANYWKSDDANTAGYIANVSGWCTTCHTRYLSDSGGTNNADAIFNYKHKSDGKTLGSANCITCHVSHGSNASMSAVANAVPNPGAAAGTVRTSSNLLRIDNKGTCQMCHNR